MTDADLARMTDALAARLGPWIRKCDTVIRAKVGDAHAHAQKALTDSLINTPEGRPSARKVLRSPSYLAALSRLDELQSVLIGPSSDSLEGLTRDARASFYASSIRLWVPYIPEQFRVSLDPKPTLEADRFFRGAIIHGYDLGRELGPKIEAGKSTLFAALNSAGRKGLPIGVSGDRLMVWREQTITQLNRSAGSILSDSDKAIHEATGWMMVHPDSRPERDMPFAGVHF